jgi:CO dehydrogenase/acetyl-CoA synthase beta subunit
MMCYLPSSEIVVSTTLQATTYPFIAVITLQYPGGAVNATPKMTVVDRIEGVNDATTVVRRLQSAKERYGPVLDRMRREKEEREMERSLRDEQDRAYRESLKADQEKVVVCSMDNALSLQLHCLTSNVFMVHRNVKLNWLVKKPLVRKRMLSALNWKRKS